MQNSHCEYADLISILLKIGIVLNCPNLRFQMSQISQNVPIYNLKLSQQSRNVRQISQNIPNISNCFK